MSWTSPKTNWISTDYFNLSDWKRIRENLIWINNWFVARGYPYTQLKNLNTPRDTMELPTVELVNKLEYNLNAIYKISLIPVSAYRDSKQWHGRLSSLYAENPTYDDWNRWEELSKYIHEGIDYVSTYLYQRICGTFYSGSDIRIQLFSRGRRLNGY